MKRIIPFLLIFLLLFGAGCSAPVPPPEPPFCRVVTQVEIAVESIPEAVQRHYSDPKAMTKLLNYIRHLDPWDIPDTMPEHSSTAVYRITLHLSDGTTKAYEQLGLTRFRQSGGSWREIPREAGIRLPLIMEAIE